MPFRITRPLNDAAILLTAARHGLGRVQRLQRSYVVARTLGLLLFAPVTTFALELGEASIKSGLGQSLLVEIPYRLAATERLTPDGWLIMEFGCGQDTDVTSLVDGVTGIDVVKIRHDLQDIPRTMVCRRHVPRGDETHGAR